MDLLTFLLLQWQLIVSNTWLLVIFILLLFLFLPDIVLFMVTLLFIKFLRRLVPAHRFRKHVLFWFIITYIAGIYWIDTSSFLLALALLKTNISEALAIIGMLSYSLLMDMSLVGIAFKVMLVLFVIAFIPEILIALFVTLLVKIQNRLFLRRARKYLLMFFIGGLGYLNLVHFHIISSFLSQYLGSYSIKIEAILAGFFLGLMKKAFYNLPFPFRKILEAVGVEDD